MSHDPAGCPRSYCPECDAYLRSHSMDHITGYPQVPDRAPDSPPTYNYLPVASPSLLLIT